jgi:hypothetical protein
MNSLNKHGWIGVDLDGTLAHYDGWCGHDHIGPPIPGMVARVKAWLAEGREVRIFTARMHEHSPVLNRRLPIEEWCREHIGQVLEVTHIKDPRMVELWDDRCIQVMPNTGEPVSQQTEALCDIARRLDDLSYEMLDHAKVSELCGLVEELQKLGCRAAGHAWVFDQCGFWQHQLCSECGESKYPDMAAKRCSVLTAEMGGMTEEEFLSGDGSAHAPRFRAGDAVHHIPSGEDWLLATDEENGRVQACGWPESMADAKDCQLIAPATFRERLDMLKTWAAEGKGYEHERDSRTRAARRQLSSENADVEARGHE